MDGANNPKMPMATVTIAIMLMTTSVSGMVMILIPVFDVECVLCRLNLRFLFARSATCRHLILVDVNANNEFFVVIRSGFFQNAVGRGYTELFLRVFLKSAFGIHIQLVFQNIRKAGENVLGDKGFCGVPTLIQIDRANEGFHGVCTNVFAVLCCSRLGIRRGS